ncbi:conserved hypothetical protein [Bacillus sp. IT-79MI2]
MNLNPEKKTEKSDVFLDMCSMLQYVLLMKEEIPCITWERFANSLYKKLWKQQYP